MRGGRMGPSTFPSGSSGLTASLPALSSVPHAAGLFVAGPCRSADASGSSSETVRRRQKHCAASRRLVEVSGARLLAGGVKNAGCAIRLTIRLTDGSGPKSRQASQKSRARNLARRWAVPLESPDVVASAKPAAAIPLSAAGFLCRKLRMLQKLSRHDSPLRSIVPLSRVNRAANDNAPINRTPQQVDAIGFALIGLLGMFRVFLLAI